MITPMAGSPRRCTGAAIALTMFPILFLVVIIQLLYIRRVEVR